jgi:hypothetical protein
VGVLTDEQAEAALSMTDDRNLVVHVTGRPWPASSTGGSMFTPSRCAGGWPGWWREPPRKCPRATGYATPTSAARRSGSPRSAAESPS